MYFKPLTFIFLVLLFANVGSATLYQAGPFNPVRADPTTWTCYDASIDFARENPDWGVVTVSNNPVFRGVSHIVNYQFRDEELYLYDATQNLQMGFCDKESARVDNIQFEHAYYHIWQDNETPLRNYRVLKDNLEECGVKVV